MTIQKVLTWATEILKKTSTSPSLDAEVLLYYTLKKPKEFILTNQSKKLTSKQLNKFKNLIEKRSIGIPVAYLTGHKEFYGLDFMVNKQVLIPRPETEELVQLTLNRIMNYELGIRNVVDIGTGSGNIITSIAVFLGLPRGGEIIPNPNKLLPASTRRLRQGGRRYAPRNDISFYGTDLSKKALQIARKNARRHGVKIKFLKGNLLDPLFNLPFIREKKSADHSWIVLANLPYIEKVPFSPRREPSPDQTGLRFEPKQALFTTEKGLKQIRLLLKQIGKLKHLPKIILLEFDPRQKTSLKKLVNLNLPTAKITFFKDLSGKWSFVEISI
ncbi:MAG: peptide chain release factor N(5)-glutamine methyltransferase [Candidatus Doudnabacteria bacterium CG10_big_fil_rev_8_21_14_0_10_41_10]|uniref:Peptide chain release factor N(5)-glutamine methyltransferase n=1 Tax=Candidatus Doudnabacteria bacterium CG10_big_fil_rev_8_21_14_0_10_41_10 TaxID=1974551 RepID=A0A2H0VCG3_9BACT|nr:MAG: peptide chain release factor N(5)-glutamine methyltransferase [Candidatus Doudnabacteria bacterium CG10_big_fil_rev_8_21_14_0_10_41_10]